MELKRGIVTTLFSKDKTQLAVESARFVHPLNDIYLPVILVVSVLGSIQMFAP